MQNLFSSGFISLSSSLAFCCYFSLHKNLTEHLNAEIVLHTISDISVAVEWLRYTFLYIRVFKNPKHYGRINSEIILFFAKFNNIL